MQVSGLFFSILGSAEGNLNQAYVPILKPFYEAIFAKLSKVDIDQEVKKRSIIAAADLISVSNTVLTAEEVARIMQVLTERLKQDLTREAALKGITLIILNETNNSYQGSRYASKNNKKLINLNGLQILLPSLYDLLGKSQRSVQLSTLELFEALTRRYGAQFVQDAAKIQDHISELISDSDLQRMELAFRVASHLVRVQPSANAHKKILMKSIEACKSQLVQGSCLHQLFEFFKAAAQAKIVDSTVVSHLLSTITLKTQNGAACVAILV